MDIWPRVFYQLVFAAGTDSDVLSSVNCSEVLGTLLYSDF